MAQEGVSSTVGPASDQHPGWDDPQRVHGYLERVGRLEPRLEGEDALRALLPAAPSSVLDLGCGDARLAALVVEACPSITRVVGIDASPPMLERARARFAADAHASHTSRSVEIRMGELDDDLRPLGRFDLVVSGFAIHHVEHLRKRELFGEVADVLTPGGLFANLEIVASPTPELHADFLAAIGRTADDPEDRLADVDDQLGWMTQAGLVDVACTWHWKGMALLVGRGAGGPS